MTQGIIHPVLADASTTAVLADFTAQIDVLSATVIATVPAKICNDRFPGEGRGGCAVAVTAPRGGAAGNLVARSFLQSAPTTDLAIVNSGGVRVSIAAGDYTINDAYTLLPFANMLVTIEMTGAQVVQVLEEAFANVLDNGGSTGGYPYASGLRFDVDASAAAGMRVTNIEVNSRLAAAWTAIAPAATYTVVTTDYLGKGKDGYLTFGAIPDAQKVNLYIDYAQAFMNYAEAEGTLVAPAEAEFSTQSYVGADGVWTGSSPAPTTAPTPAPTTATSGAAAAASASFLGIAAAALLL
ncbi:5'-nucleotidase [Pelagophyceae sp. CCMP2097]|nr:5'-nucleotidase [Pelagophyceae sp. CCMP2097]